MSADGYIIGRHSINGGPYYFYLLLFLSKKFTFSMRLGGLFEVDCCFSFNINALSDGYECCLFNRIVSISW